MKSQFQKDPLYFCIYADFEAVNEIDNSNKDKKTTKRYRQNLVCNAFYLVYELKDVLINGYYKYPLGYDIVDWFVNEVMKLHEKMVFCFKKTNTDITMNEKDDEQYRNTTTCRFFEKKIFCDKVRHRCHLKRKYRKPAHNKRMLIVTQEQSNFVPFAFHNLIIFNVNYSAKNWLL